MLSETRLTQKNMYIVRFHLCENQEEAKQTCGDRSEGGRAGGSKELTEKDVRGTLQGDGNVLCLFGGSSQVHKIVKVH